MKGFICLFSASMLAMSLCVSAASSENPERADDLNYGKVLYEYYQGNAFEALSLLRVAKEKGGIKGHGDHPELVEGGLLLSYGMTLEAKSIFEKLLKEKLSIKDQNLAWFYLGKVFYLEANYQQALESFDKIQSSVLKDQEIDKFYELLYIKGQIASLFSSNHHSVNSTVWMSELPEDHIFQYYLRYNQAVKLIDGDENKAAIVAFNSLIKRLSKERQDDGSWKNDHDTDSPDSLTLAMEIRALFNQSLLSLGQLYLQNKFYEQAFSTLKLVDKDSAFSDQALFSYAIAASQLERYQLALSALNQLNERSLFNPWQQQTPYALAFLYEQLKEPVLALEGYRAAVAQYESLQENLSSEKENLSIDILLDALNLTKKIGSEYLAKDAYGRVNASLSKFDFAHLLSTESFQRQLSELHELYSLKNSMHRWQKQLVSFDDMLETRLLSRQQKISATQKELASKEVEKWAEKEASYKHKINSALAREDAFFFMTEVQLDYAKRLEKAQERLRLLPNDHKKKTAYQQRFERVKAYFDWWVHDEYSVNRWRAQKELRDLQEQMTLFRKQYDVLNSQEDVDQSHRMFVERVSSGRDRLSYLQSELEKSIASSSKKLVAQVDRAMAMQLEQIAQYLLASREALARVSDQLLVDGKLAYQTQTDAEDLKESDSDNFETKAVEGVE